MGAGPSAGVPRGHHAPPLLYETSDDHHQNDPIDMAGVNDHVHIFRPSAEELKKLQNQFRSLKQSAGGTVAEKLNREAFHHNFSKKLKPQFIDKIFNALDWDHSGEVSFREFVMLTHILFAGTNDEKIDYLFVLYDKDGDGYLAGDEIGRLAHGSSAAMRSLLRSLHPESDGKTPSLPATPEEKERAEKLLAQQILKEADRDKDGRIGIKEFKAYCLAHPQMLQELAQLRGILLHILGDDIADAHHPSPKVGRSTAPIIIEPPAAAHAPSSPPLPHPLKPQHRHHSPTRQQSVPREEPPIFLNPNELPPSKPARSPKSSPKITHLTPPPDLLVSDLPALDELQLAADRSTSSTSVDKIIS